MFSVRCQQCNQHYSLKAVPTQRKSFTCQKCDEMVRVVPPSEPPVFGAVGAAQKPAPKKSREKTAEVLNRVPSSDSSSGRTDSPATKEKKARTGLVPPDHSSSKTNHLASGKKSKPDLPHPNGASTEGKKPALTAPVFQEVNEESLDKTNTKDPSADSGKPALPESTAPKKASATDATALPLPSTDENSGGLGWKTIAFAAAAILLIGGGTWFFFFQNPKQTGEKTSQNTDAGEEEKNRSNQSKKQTVSNNQKETKQNRKETPGKTKKQSPVPTEKKLPDSKKEMGQKNSPDTGSKKQEPMTNVDSENTTKSTNKTESNSPNTKQNEPPKSEDSNTTTAQNDPKNVTPPNNGKNSATTTVAGPYGIPADQPFELTGPDFAERVEFPSVPSRFAFFHHPFLGKFSLVDIASKLPPNTREFILDKDGFSPGSLLSPDGKYVVGEYQKQNSTNRSLGVVSTESGKVIHALKGTSSAPRFAEFLNGTDLMVIDRARNQPWTASIWNVATAEKTGEFQLPELAKEFNDITPNFAVSPDRQQLAFGAADGVLRIIGIADGDLKFELKFDLPTGRYAAAKELAFSPDGKRLAVWYKFGETGRGKAPNSSIIGWEIESQQEVCRHDFDISLSPGILKFRSDDNFIWLPDESGWVAFGKWIIDYETGKVIATLEDPPGLYLTSHIRPFSDRRFILCQLFNSETPGDPRQWRIHTAEPPWEIMKANRTLIREKKKLEIPDLPTRKIPDLL